MGIKKSSRVRNSSRSSVNVSSGSQARSRPIIQPSRNLRPTNSKIITRTGRKSSFGFININNLSLNSQQAGPATPQPQAGPTTPQPQAGPAIPEPQARPAIPEPQAGPAILQQQPRTRSFFNRFRRREINTNESQLTQNNKNEIFSILNKNITFILQRHATSCANIINKGFKTGSTSYLTFGKTQLVAEIAPDSMLSSIGVDECNQVHDYLTNQGTELTNLDGFDYLFCCSELIRTQQTMFLSYFELIHSRGIKIMVLPWLNEEHAIGGMNKDNLTISLDETKRRWEKFIQSLIEFPIQRRLLDILRSETSIKNSSVFIPPKKLSPEEIQAKDRLIKKVKLMYGEKIDINAISISKKIKEETEKYNKFLKWDDVFCLPDFIYRDPTNSFDKRTDLERLYKIKMKESGIKTKSYNANDLLFALPFILHLNNKKQKLEKQELKVFMTGHSHTMVQLMNFITLQTNNGRETPYYSKPYLEKQQMMNAEIIALQKIQLSRLINIRDFSSAIGPNAIQGAIFNHTEPIETKFNELCRKFPVGFSEHLISKQLKGETFKKISPFYFFYNSNLGIVYSLADIVNQGIETKNGALYKEDYPLRVFFGMTLLQYVGYLMVAKVVVSKMKDKFKINPKYDYQGLLDKISELEKNIREYVGDTEKVNSKKNNRSLQVINASESVQNASNPARNASNQQPQQKPQPNASQLGQNASQLGQNASNPARNASNPARNASNPARNASQSAPNASNSAQNPSQKGGQEANVINLSTASKYMEKNEKVYFETSKKSPTGKYSTTIKQFLFDTLSALERITDRQQKRKVFVRLLHTSLLSTCDIKPNQENKITNFMKNSFPTGLLEPESKTPTRRFNEQGQGMLEKLTNLNTKTGNNINKIKEEYGNLVVPFVPFVPLSVIDNTNQLDKIINRMKEMGMFIDNDKKSINNKSENLIMIDNDIFKRTRILNLLPQIYPSIDESVGKYIIGIIYKTFIEYYNNNFYYRQSLNGLFQLSIMIYIDNGIQSLLNFLKNTCIIFYVIQNIDIENIFSQILNTDKKNISLSEHIQYLFFSIDIDKLTGYTIHEIMDIKKRYFYFNDKYKHDYEKYGLSFFYFSLFIPDLIYYMSSEKNFSKNFEVNKSKEYPNIKIKYLAGLTISQIETASKEVIKKFMPRFYMKLKNIRKKLEIDNNTEYKSVKNDTGIIDVNNNYKRFMESQNNKPIPVHFETQKSNSNSNSNNSTQKKNLNINIQKLLDLIIEPVKFEEYDKAIATISGIPKTKFDKNLVSPHFFAFEFNLDKIKEVCSKGLMKYSKKDCIQFVKADISNIMECVKQLFHTEIDIWKYFVEIQVSLIKQGFVFASQEINTLIYISRLFGSSFDSILEIFYQSFPYMMFCFEYVIKISELFNNNFNSFECLNELFDNIGIEKMIILYKYLNITNIDVMLYIKKYGIIFLIYALLTPFHIFQTELTGKNNTSYKETIINKLKAMDKFIIVKNVKSAFDDKKIVEFISKVGEKKNDIFGKAPVAQNNSNSNLNLNKLSNNGNTYNGSHKPELPKIVNTEPNRQTADFIWSVFTTPFVPITVDGNINVLDEIIAFYKTQKVGVYKRKIVKQVTRDYSDNKNAFIIICKNYLKMNDEQSIKFYDSYWRNILETYENLNIPYSQNHKLFAYISLFYKYDKLEFFRNNFLITSLLYEFGTSIEFSDFLGNFYKLSILNSNNERKKFNNIADDTYIQIMNILSLGVNGSGGHIIDNIFSYISEEYYNIDDIKENIETILYYILNYNDIYILEFYKKQGYGILCLFFLKDLPNYILYDDYIKNTKLMDNYGHPQDNVIPEYRGKKSYNITCKLRNIDYILELSKNKEEYYEKSKYIINEYLPKYIEYFNNQTKKLKSVKNNKNINKIMKFNETNKKGIFTNGSQNDVSNNKHENSADPVVINKATQLLTQGVYFLS